MLVACTGPYVPSPREGHNTYVWEWGGWVEDLPNFRYSEDNFIVLLRIEPVLELVSARAPII